MASGGVEDLVASQASRIFPVRGGKRKNTAGFRG